MTPKTAPTAEFEELSPTAYRAVITVPVDLFRGKLDSVYNDLSKNLNIPGFRPGKAPRGRIDSFIGGRKKIFSEVYEDIIQDTVWPMVNDRELTLIGQPRIDFDDWVEGKDFRYTVVLEIVPPIPEIEYEELKAVLPEREITDEMMEGELRRIGIRLGESTEIKDRPVVDGDFLMIHFEGEVPDVMMDTIEGEKPWKVVEEFMEIEVGSSRSIEGLNDQLIGMELEEIKEFELVLPDDFRDRKVWGKTLRAKARVLNIREVTPVELTDEIIAEKFGEREITDLDALKEQIRQEIYKNWTQVDERVTMDQVENHFFRTFEFPLPEGLVRARYLDILDRTLDALKRDGGDVDKLMEDGNEVGLRIRKRSRYQAQRMVRLELIMREIARKESVGVTNEEVANYIMMIAMRQGINEKDLKTLMQDSRFINDTKDEILNKKVTHFLLSKVGTDKISEDEFLGMIEDTREKGKALENEFVENAEDPNLTIEQDYLGGTEEGVKEEIGEEGSGEDLAQAEVSADTQGIGSMEINSEEEVTDSGSEEQ